MTEEKIYTVNISDAYKAPRPVRARKAMKYLKDYLKKHLKAEEILIGPGLNHEIWSRGIKKPPKKVKVAVSKEGEKFKAELFGYKPKKIKPKEEKQVEEKKEEPEKKEKPKEQVEEKKQVEEPTSEKSEGKEQAKIEEKTESSEKTSQPEEEQNKSEGEK